MSDCGDPKQWSDAEVLRRLADTADPLDKARREFTLWCARLERDSLQHALDWIDLRRREFQAAVRIANVLGYLNPAEVETQVREAEAQLIYLIESFIMSARPGLLPDYADFLQRERPDVVAHLRTKLARRNAIKPEIGTDQ